MHLVYLPKILHNDCFQFLLGITVVPRGIQDNGYAKFWGVNKVHYGLCENVEFGKLCLKTHQYFIKKCVNTAFSDKTLLLVF